MAEQEKTLQSGNVTSRYSDQAIEKTKKKNFKKWLQKALRIHATKYNYEGISTQYHGQKAAEISIFCNRHQFSFRTTPHDHLRYPSGGCKLCEKEIRGRKVLNKKEKEFTDWFNKTCTDRLVILSPFNGMTKPMTFGCKLHGTTKSNMPTELKVNGYKGCDGCSKGLPTLGKLKTDFSDLLNQRKAKSKQRAAAENWLKKVEQVNFGRFTYHRVLEQYQSEDDEIEIFCNHHQKFFKTTPANHPKSMTGNCPDCNADFSTSADLPIRKEAFFKWLEAERNTQLELTSEYRSIGSPVEIKCLIHNRVQKATPLQLMLKRRSGCDLCAIHAPKSNRQMKTEAKLYKELLDILPEKVEILGFIRNVSTQALITCKLHSTPQRVSIDYLRRSNHKCPKCGRLESGYTSNRLLKLVENDQVGLPTFIGLMEIEAFGVKALKVGVTTRKLEERYAYHLKKIFFSTKMPERDAYILENRVHREFKHEKDTRILKAGMRGGKRWSGDTELYWFRNKEKIKRFIKDQLLSMTSSKIDYLEELSKYEVPDTRERDVSRAKDLTNQPVAVIGIDPDTYQIIKRFDCIADSVRAGFHGVSECLQGNRRIVGGLRWFIAENFNENDIPPLRNDKSKQIVEVRKDPSLLIGIEIDTKKVLHQFSCINEAKRSGFKNISQAFPFEKRAKTKSMYGCYWKFEDNFDPNIKAIKYPSISEAIRAMKKDGFIISIKGIKSSIQKQTPDGNGFRWRFV